MIIQPDSIKEYLTPIDAIDDGFNPSPAGIWSNPVPAAVLLPLVKEKDEWHLLFIKRTRHPDDPHSGQIAFPGGRTDQRDQTLLDTALREAGEEIGVDPGDIEILGFSCPITTVTNYRISPIVGILPWPYSLNLSPKEVQKAFLIPLAWLNDPNHRQERSWQSRSHPGEELDVFFFEEYEGEVLWGATAQIVVDFLDLIQLRN
jgi:8-oxo-dGTP pyrophosphatase MutT (NUDIX family)